MTWAKSWAKLNADGTLEERSQQRTLAEAVFDVTENGGTLLGEAGTGTGKSYAYLIPLIVSVHRKERSVVSTETTALQDQLVDKDLPHLHSVFGGFKYCSLKGRSNYLCLNRADNNNGIVLRLKTKDVGIGERRDVERVLGWRIDDQDWEEISGTSDYCASNRCAPEKCYSARARKLALDSDIVVTNHALLMTHAEYDILGDFKHLVVDEAHTLEKVLIDGWTESATPWDIYKAKQNIWDGISAAYLGQRAVPKMQEAERLMKLGLDSIVNLFVALYEQRHGFKPDETVWKRETFTLSEQYLSGPQSQKVITRLGEYEGDSPKRLETCGTLFTQLSKMLYEELDVVDSGRRKIRKGATSAKKLADICDKLGESLTTRDGIVFRYGAPYAILGDGWKTYKGDHDVRIRCVPLDVSARISEALWKGKKSVTLVSATLSDLVPGDFTYTIASLGLTVDKTVMVNSPFDYASQQLVYFTNRQSAPVDVVGAQFSLDELEQLLCAADGRSLVLFTARTELDFAADELMRREFPHEILVQEKSSNKQVLVEKFREDKHSVLLATKSFFTGVDFPGETCSLVLLAKYPLPQYNALCRAQIAWWRKRGFPDWYDREGTLVFRQAIGRLIRTEKDRGVVAVLDQRQGMMDKAAEICRGSPMTMAVEDVKQWLSTK